MRQLDLITANVDTLDRLLNFFYDQNSTILCLKCGCRSIKIMHELRKNGIRNMGGEELLRVLTR